MNCIPYRVENKYTLRPTSIVVRRVGQSLGDIFRVILFANSLYLYSIELL